jgi:Flp pilus assembly protein TadG
MTPAKHRMRFARQRACRLRRLAARSGCDERGSSMVEFALGASLLFMLVFGVIAMCLALYSYNVVSEAAREATRYAIVRGSACTSFATACPAASPDIQTYVKGLTYPGINPNNLTAVTAWSPYPAGATCQPLLSCNNPGNQVMVTVTYQFPLVIPFVPSRTLSMSSTAEMVISQ